MFRRGFLRFSCRDSLASLGRNSGNFVQKLTGGAVDLGQVRIWISEECVVSTKTARCEEERQGVQSLWTQILVGVDKRDQFTALGAIANRV